MDIVKGKTLYPTEVQELLINEVKNKNQYEEFKNEDDDN